MCTIEPIQKPKQKQTAKVITLHKQEKTGQAQETQTQAKRESCTLTPSLLHKAEFEVGEAMKCEGHMILA